MYLWALQVDLCLPVHVSHPYELQLKTQIKSCILNCKKPLLSIITGRKRYTWGGVLFFESNESVVVTQLTSLLKLTTVHEHLDGFYNRVKVGMLFTLSSIRKTLIICPAKQKPSTNLLCIAWGILTKKGVDLAFASVRTWSEDSFTYFILLMRCKNNCGERIYPLFTSWSQLLWLLSRDWYWKTVVECMNVERLVLWLVLLWNGT